MTLNRLIKKSKSLFCFVLIDSSNFGDGDILIVHTTRIKSITAPSTGRTAGQ